MMELINLDFHDKMIGGIIIKRLISRLLFKLKPPLCDKDPNSSRICLLI